VKKNLPFIILAIINICLLEVASANAQQNLLYKWAAGFGSPDQDVGREIRVDSQGNAIVVCDFNGTVDFDPSLGGIANLTSCSNMSQIAIAKYDSSGNYIWAKTLCSTAGDDYPYAMELDSSNNIYISGAFGGTTDFDPGPGIANLTGLTSLQIYIAKYDSSGNYLWVKHINTTTGSGLASDIAVAANGDFVITGWYSGTIDFDPGPGTATYYAGGGDTYIAKYDNMGNHIWSFVFGNAISATNHEGWGIDLDNSGNIYLTGSFSNTVDFDPGAGTDSLTASSMSSIFISKYSSNGTYQWAKVFLGGGDYDEGRSVTVTPSGNVCVTGNFSDTTDFDPGPGVQNIIGKGLSDIFLVQLDNSGNLMWINRFGDNSGDAGFSISSDAGNNVYISGYFTGICDFDPGSGTSNLSSNGFGDIFIAKYDALGTHKWSKNLGGSQFDYSFCNYVHPSTNDVYMAGHFKTTVDFDPGPGSANFTSAGGFDLWFGRYTQSIPVGSMEDVTYDPVFNIYPNPFSSSAICSFFNDFDLHGKCLHFTLFDAKGKIVKQIQSETLQFTIEREKLISGLYFYQINTSEKVLSTGKLSIID
jgi:hypothetical protein